ncbi:MAG TPA: hypothetical protein VLZ06_10380 [Solirubrobacteraceae bacterium]|nr:hypothetical protein [Solirubrobacteraceae bacterium]
MEADPASARCHPVTRGTETPSGDLGLDGAGHLEKGARMNVHLTDGLFGRAASLRRAALASLATLLVLLAVPGLAAAEAPSNAGKEFWMGFPSN